MGQIRRLLKIVFTLVTLVTSKKRRQAAALQSASREILTPENQFLISGLIRLVRVIRGKVHSYSYRSASIGSSAAALRAGQKPKNTPTAAANKKAMAIELREISVGQLA